MQRLTQRRAGGSCGPTGASRAARTHWQALRDETQSVQTTPRDGPGRAGRHGRGWGRVSATRPAATMASTRASSVFSSTAGSGTG